MRRWLIVILIALLAGLQYRLWIGEGSLAQIWSLKKAGALQSEENAVLKERNAVLEADVQDLKQGLDAAEERARTELGMIKDGEVFYQIIEPQTR